MELQYKKASLEDLELLTETRIEVLRAKEVGPCALLNEGDTFIFEGNAKMPQGFCPFSELLGKAVHGHE